MKKIFTFLFSIIYLVGKTQTVSYSESFGTSTGAALTYTGYTSWGSLTYATSYPPGGSVNVANTSPRAAGTGSYLIADPQNLASTFKVSGIAVPSSASLSMGFWLARNTRQSTINITVYVGGTATVITTMSGANAPDWQSTSPGVKTETWAYYATKNFTTPATANATIDILISFTSEQNGNKTLALDGLEVASFSALPLTSRNFTAAPRNGQVDLNWTGVATSLNASFEVERSAGGNSKFEKITTIAVKNTGEAQYQYTDIAPVKPESQYRIKIIDENRRISYTRTLKVTLGGHYFALDNLYPTVAQGQINLVLSNSISGKAQLEFIDITGRLVLQETIFVTEGSQHYPVNIDRLSKGSFTLLIKNGNEVITRRFIKQ
ncbi:T9SS type A sorting domain-containing protein [Flavihumibacter profundi]|uniref:T9SS type A sorting domain-containing protein n=1 Tax=Flavihumibacter profundi TaxID=2716883 RepID=UPI001CC39BB8|nr:T9SS type A sorting domain-containing protein [Flavihumibacter profundi]MBZ5857365.1 T9SS type A sorting domain-containing protein [Flavihumibacter profundi]